MRLHKPETQTLYAQLFKATAAYQVELLGGFSTGFAIERTVRGRPYLYWQLRDVHGTQRQVYLGAADNEQALQLREALIAFKAKRRPILNDLTRLVAAYVASGGAHHIGNHFKVVDALARAGLFRVGAVLVGSYAFVSIGAALGITWTADTTATADVDFERDEFVSVAADEVRAVNLPRTLQSGDPSFFLVPELDLKTPRTSLRSAERNVVVDFLTTAKHPRDSYPRTIGPFGMAAQPSRYMDFLIRDNVQRALFIGAQPVLVNVPDAGRFALHKLAVSQRRAGGSSSIKADKDRRQAAALIQALYDLQPGVLALAIEAANAHHDKGLLRDIRASIRRLPLEARIEI